MSPKLQLVAITVCGALAVGCGTRTNYTPTNTPPQPMQPRAPETVEVFTASEPRRAFVEVGIVHAQQKSAFSTHSEPQVIARLREEAARHGCDGVIIAGAHNATVGSSFDGSGGTSTLTGYRGACIVYELEGEAPAQVEAAEAATDDNGPAESPETAPSPMPETTPSEPPGSAETSSSDVELPRTRRLPR